MMKPQHENPSGSPQYERPQAKEASGGIVGRWISSVHSKVGKVADWFTQDWTFESWKDDEKSWKWKESKPWPKWRSSEQWSRWDHRDDERKAA